ncbi:MAG: hypothetical protein ABEJ02_01655 [Candidatus Paceibacteria bacterium]
MSLSEEEKKNFSFNEDYRGFGLYEMLEQGNHKGEGILIYGKVGGNANLHGSAVAYGAEIEGKPTLSGHLPARNANINGNPHLFGYGPALESKIGGNPEIEGYCPAHHSNISGDPKIEGYDAAGTVSIEKGANPQIKNYRLRSFFPERFWSIKSSEERDADQKKNALNKYSKFLDMKDYRDSSDL